MKKYIALTLVGLLLSLTLGIVIGAIIDKTVHFHGSIVSELADVSFYADAECTTPITDIEWGEMPLLSEHYTEIYAKNSGIVSSVDINAELLNGTNWMMVAPSYFSIPPQEVVQFQVGAVVPADAVVGADVNFDIHFFESEVPASSIPVGDGLLDVSPYEPSPPSGEVTAPMSLREMICWWLGCEV